MQRNWAGTMHLSWQRFWPIYITIHKHTADDCMQLLIFWLYEKFVSSDITSAAVPTMKTFTLFWNSDMKRNEGYVQWQDINSIPHVQKLLRGWKNINRLVTKWKVRSYLQEKNRSAIDWIDLIMKKTMPGKRVNFQNQAIFKVPFIRTGAQDTPYLVHCRYLWTARKQPYN